MSVTKIKHTVLCFFLLILCPLFFLETHLNTLSHFWGPLYLRGGPIIEVEYRQKILEIASERDNDLLEYAIYL